LLAQISERLTQVLETGGTIYLCGNGGSAADAQHIAAELVGRYLRERQPLPAVALTTNTSILTAIGNDYDFTQVFARQVRAMVTSRDAVVGISTSGKSPNVLEALRAAREIGALTVGFTGMSGQPMVSQSDLCLCVPSTETPRIQEAHILAWHIICDLIERSFSNAS
jgi:D-sedoheptulose 7-phosphate isomerase